MPESGRPLLLTSTPVPNAAPEPPITEFPLYRRGKEEIANYRENKFGASHNFNAMDGSERLSAFDHGYARGREIEISRKTTKPIKGPES